jgi:hypothetical protein
MSRPRLLPIESGTEGWDSVLRTNLLILGGFSDADGEPFPIKTYPGFANLPTASQNDQCVAAFDSGSGQFRLVLSLGTVTAPAGGNWAKIPVQAAAQADFAGADLAALKVELNTFLAKLRTAGTIAP